MIKVQRLGNMTPDNSSNKQHSEITLDLVDFNKNMLKGLVE